jgi:hypothetical protein
MTVARAIRRRRAPRPHLLLFVLVLLFSTLTPRTSALRVPLRHVATLVSLSHSLLSRAAITRVAHGDAVAAARVRWIASLLSSRGAWGLGWDYLRHYAFSSAIGCGLSCAAAASRLIAAAAQASRLRSATDVVQWMRLHYGDICDAASQLLNGLLLTFSEEVTDLFTRGASDSHIALSICDICCGLGSHWERCSWILSGRWRKGNCWRIAWKWELRTYRVCLSLPKISSLVSQGLLRSIPSSEVWWL